ncbi:hypothetical protein [Chitinophaga sp. LS1]|uniref:hypothetical protein n=1 Tax=Chitinophaga sp. LS1 TaxID=3051176 RepID=UPI002AAB7559|nr:hypothetical protein [Chitinophaga sp. LS1]WPV64103.1 hypothetical protein QQL36_20075 [Chitinophaga sp. LS1]
MKKLFIFLLLGASACNVLNPNITDDVYVDNAGAASSWVNGVSRQLALTMNQVVVSSELVSDNYYNNRTQSSKVFDIPQIDYYDTDVNNMQTQIAILRTMAEYGLSKVLPGDVTSTASDSAEMYYSSGYAHILSGELFVGLPGSEKGRVLTPTEHLNLAIASLNSAITLADAGSTAQMAYTLLKARAFYSLGNADSAVAIAKTAMSIPTLLQQVKYDGTNSVTNDMQTYVFSSTYNEFAPSPRLDFLDPKYYHTGLASADQKPVTIVKAEEAWLIVAEAAIAGNDLSTARTTLKDLLSSVIANRPTVSLNDSKETRNGGNRTDYPLTAELVKFDAADNTRSGYILNRQAGNITAYTVSGTKVTATDLDAATTQDELLYLLYRMRQEIFMAEGRRMTDLGIKFPVSQTEQLNNTNVSDADIVAQIPSFIPRARGMDDFTNDTASGIVTMKYDMNKVLVENKTSPYIFPFIN